MLCAFILASICLLFIQSVKAQDQGQGRFKWVAVQTTQFVWEIVSKSSGAAVCEVLLDRESAPTLQEVISSCSDRLSLTPATSIPSGATLTATTAPANPNLFYSYYFWRFKTKREFTQSIKIPLPEIVLNISIPQGPVPKPFITLIAYEPATEYKISTIHGKLNGADFSCDGNQCDIFFTQQSIISFKGISTFGDSSGELQATIQIIQRDSGYFPVLSNLSPFTLFNDRCANVWGTDTYQYPKWAEFPQLPDQLNTKKTLYFLTSRLLFTGLVNAKDCPGQGFLTAASPNACGMDRARATMIDWQNQYDPMIWSASRKVGIPPKIIKTMIEKESQFWPGNARNFIQEYGLAQMNQIGADVALRWNNDLFKQSCNNVLSNCNIPYASLPSWQQAMIRGNLMRFIDSECPGCVNGIDQTTTNQSIEVAANVLKANCAQVNYIMQQNYIKSSYEDMWKFTVASYHSGYQCLNDAVDASFRAGETASWANVSNHLECPGGKEYVDDFWANLTSFDSNLKSSTAGQHPAVLPTFLPTKTPIPTAVPVYSKIIIRVFVYVEVPGKAFPNDIQMSEGVPVQVNLPDGTKIVKNTINGQATFDLSTYPVGSEVSLSLPGLYRSFTTKLTEAGEIMVPFRLQQPVLPPSLP